MAELKDVPVTEIEKRGLSALAPLASVSPSGLTPGGGKMGRPIAQANIQLELPEFDPENLPEWAEEFAEFLLLTGQSHVDVATKWSLLKRSCKKKILQKQVKQIVKTCSTWAEVLPRFEKTFPVYETDLSVRTQIGSYLSSLSFHPLREFLNMHFWVLFDVDFAMKAKKTGVRIPVWRCGPCKNSVQEGWKLCFAVFSGFFSRHRGAPTPTTDHVLVPNQPQI